MSQEDDSGTEMEIGSPISFDSEDGTRQLGENGCCELTDEGVGSRRVAFFFKLVRGLSDSSLASYIDLIIQESIEGRAEGSEESALMVSDLFVLMFQTRNCRGGKGERSLFYKMLLKLFAHFPETVLLLLPLIAKYGYFKDFMFILELTAQQEDANILRLRAAIIDLLAKQMISDEAALAASKSVSLCAKYVPRSRSKFAIGVNKSAYDQLKSAIFPGERKTSALYRKMVRDLTRHLDVPEVKMCGSSFSAIDFSKVPSLCTNRNRKAFLNEKKKGKDLRHPDNRDRVQCMENFREAIRSSKLNGKQLHPHEIVTQIRKLGDMSEFEVELMDVQWRAIRQSVLDDLAALIGNTENALNMDKLVPLVDVSGSMVGIPMNAAIALGILVSELNHPSFRDQFITFHERPTWVSLAGLTTIKEKVDATEKAEWGGSTNFETAFNLIIDVIVKNNLPASAVPDLIVFSDMQFNAASGNSKTELEHIKERFRDVGMKVCGEPYPMPRVVFWNLRGDTSGHPAAAADDNVMMLSGFSPSMLKVVLSGDELPAAVSDDKAGAEKAKVDPYITFRKVVDDETYYPVRELLSGSNEGVLAHYSFTAPAQVDSTPLGREAWPAPVQPTDSSS